MNDITRIQAAEFAVAIYNEVRSANPMMPSPVIMEAAERLDFKSEDIPGDVRRIVADLKEEWPVVTVVGER